jgi:2-keto-4-pentenoate hydratase/2-oxohepta-3-ene-1,7-dioic acid hydratase in catechol pathway
MRFARVHYGDSDRVVTLDSAGVMRDITERVGGASFPADLIAAGALDILRATDLTGFDEVDESEIEWLPPIEDPRRILCVGFNYRNHAAEMDKPPPPYPTFFVRFPSSLTGHLQPLERAEISDSLDWEGEVAFVIGRGGRNISADDAMDHVLGFTAFGDNSVREFQLHGTQATAGKNFDRTGSYGPWIVTGDEVGDPGALEVFTYLNGEQVQHGVLKDLIFDVQAIIAYVSSWTELSPGDVIATGTPSGIGFRQDPPRYLQPGDQIIIDVPGVSRLVNTAR